ncbi:FIVAR domain-containing protein, partial [Staphylococcus capitis]|uniref:FIVAR domain-containing protein n=1 Tax=Staphylococcus capitis TaxID=29388 RepID=UPI0011A9A640
MESGQDLDHGMECLRESMGKQDEVKSERKYLNEDGSVKGNYDEGVEGGEDIINGSENGEVNKGSIE